MDCTQWVLRKLRLERFVYGGRAGGSYDSSLNDIIFESNIHDMQEGLLMRES